MGRLAELYPGAKANIVPGQKHRAGVRPSFELTRVLDLPEREPVRGDIPFPRETRENAREWPDVSPTTVQAALDEIRVLRLPDASMRLHPLQAWALLEARLFGGFFGQLAVGSGKTLIGLLLPTLFPECKTTCLLAPAGLVKQAERFFDEYSKHFRIRSDVWIASYSELSSKNGREFLSELQPDLLVLDEAHKLRNLKSGRGNRVALYMKANPKTIVCDLSGTMTNASILDYAHLMEWALKDRSPLPRPSLFRAIVKEWAEALDVPKFGPPRPAGALLQLARGKQSARQAYQRKLLVTPGVMVSDGTDLGIELRIDLVPTPKDERIKHALEELSREWKRPDGAELISQLEFSACERSLRLGGFHSWKWPGDRSEEDIRLWIETRKLFYCELRELVARTRRFGTDTLGLATERLESGELVLPSYDRWKEVRDRIGAPDTRWAWLSKSRLREAIRIASERPCIVWTDRRILGRALAREGGFEYFGAGAKDVARLQRWIDDGDTARTSHASERSRASRSGKTRRRSVDAEGRASGIRSIVCSVQAHGTGRDGLQRLYHRNLVFAALSNGQIAEQLLGRTHRVGQTKPVEVYVFDCFRRELERALADARYQRETFGMGCKLLFARKGKRKL